MPVWSVGRLLPLVNGPVVPSGRWMVVVQVWMPAGALHSNVPATPAFCRIGVVGTVMDAVGAAKTSYVRVAVAVRPRASVTVAVIV